MSQGEKERNKTKEKKVVISSQKQQKLGKREMRGQNENGSKGKQKASDSKGQKRGGSVERMGKKQNGRDGGIKKGPPKQKSREDALVRGGHSLYFVNRVRGGRKSDQRPGDTKGGKRAGLPPFS